MDIHVENTFGNRLRASREAKNLTQKDLADRVKKDEAVISKWERGRNLPQKANFARLAEALGVDLQWLKTGVQPARDFSITPSDRLVAEIAGLDTPTRELLEETLDRCFKNIAQNKALSDDDIARAIKFLQKLAER